jgi:hypothetical protein
MVSHSGAAMRRVTLTNVIPVILVLGTLGLFVHKWTAEPDADAITTAASEPGQAGGGGSFEGSGAQVPPTTSMNPVPSGTPEPPNPGNTPTSATPVAPSGEPARPESAR